LAARHEERRRHARREGFEALEFERAQNTARTRECGQTAALIKARESRREAHQSEV
jgi:hypothetical protein